MYVTDKYGIQLSVMPFGICAQLRGHLDRILSTTDYISHADRKGVLFFGQFFAALAQSFYLCLAPKVAEFWFSDHQRTLANSIGFIANPVGVVIGSLAPKLIVEHVSSFTYQDSLYIINVILGIPAAITLLMSFFIRNRPPTPPSASMERHTSPPFFEGLLTVFKNRAFYVQMVTSGMATAITFALFFACDQMFHEMGYSDINGYGMALASVIGCASTLLIGYYVDHTKRFHETIKSLYLCTAVSVIAINILLRFAFSTVNLVLLLTLIVVLSFFSTPTWPIGIELGVETTFPVAEATSSGVLITCGQLQIFGLGYAMKGAANVNVFYNSSLSHNFQLAIDVWCIVTIATAIFTYFSLWPQYKRIEFERKKSLISPIEYNINPEATY
ncbi:hypothetical protein L596_028403 [Steinernema carpocapsae]|uniref:Major facilitator superfamily (MFS) profile domain-containing protein n=1 Tax=Steinernema carpocapsae TaxID=34508 RepID=A0A4V5ZXV8_STECR|nr:hypothetical protein L596_028403 [Steinernema carpocapsae]